MPVHPILQKTGRTTLQRATRLVALSAAFSILAACASGKPNAAAPLASISWPLATTQSRVVWVKNISSPADIGSGTNFWRRLQEMVVGEETSAIVRPYGVLRSAAGAIYLTDPGRGVVHSLDIAKRSYSVIGSDGDVPLRSPIGLAEDDSGRIYITDSMTGMIHRFTPKDGSLKPLLQQETLVRPTGIAFSPLSRRLYVADTMASQIVVIEQSGVINRRIGNQGEGANGFNRPTDIAIDARGQIYVTDSLNFRITVLSPDGQMLQQFGSPGDTRGTFSRPKGIAVDSVGNIYVNDSLMDAIQVFDKEGDVQLILGKKGTDPGQFWMPSGLFIDRMDQIYVADTYNRRIQIFRFLEHGDETHEGNGAKLFDRVLPTVR